MHRHRATHSMIRDVLKDAYLGLEVEQIEMTEVVGSGGTDVRVKLRETGDASRELTLEGRGAGIVDALYHGLISHYAPEYPSLKTIKFTGFEVKGRMGTGRQQGLDAEAVVSLLVQNSDAHTFEFEEANRSMVAAALEVVTDAAEFFINSERAYITVYKAYLDAKSRGRPDLTQRYTHQLAQLVDTTSYSEVIERIKKSQ